ncbi:MAG: hypothetical protein ACRYF5_10210, partial [Janthinobacterium lividum]
MRKISILPGKPLPMSTTAPPLAAQQSEAGPDRPARMARLQTRAARPADSAGGMKRSPASTLSKIQGRLVLQQRPNGPTVQTTLVDLIALSDEPTLCSQSGLLGVTSSDADGATHITIHTDDLLRSSLHEQELRDLENMIALPSTSLADKSDILKEILAHMPQRKPSPGGKHLQASITRSLADMAPLGNPRSFMRLLREIKAIWRFEDILKTYQPAVGTEAHALLTGAVTCFAQTPQVSDDDDVFHTLLANIEADLERSCAQNTRFKLRAICVATLDTYRPPAGSPAYEKLATAIAFLDNSGTVFDAESLRSLVRGVCFDLQLDAQRSMPAWYRPEEDRLFMPTRSMKTWIVALEKTRSSSANASARQQCRALLVQAKQRWLRHALRFDEMRDFFARMQAATAAQGFDDLQMLAARLLQKTPGAQHDDFDVDKDALSLKTRLHDNVDYRVFESAL